MVRTLTEGVWGPSALGDNLYDMWDAEQPATLTLVGSAVSAWASVKNAMSLSQGTGAARPIYSATSFNGRPGLTLDGSDDELAVNGVGSLPTGATEAEMWALVDQKALVADATARWIMAYGGTTTSTLRAVGRTVISSANQAECYGNNSGAASRNTAVDFSGIHVVRGRINTADIVTDVDGQGGTSQSGTPAAGTTRTRIGGSPNSTPLFFWNGGISFIAITKPLAASDAAKMLTYLKARGGIA
jgi:hypothetical protein